MQHLDASRMAGATAVVDPDDPATWPPEVLDWLTERFSMVGGASGWTSALHWELVERESDFVALLAGRKVLMYHCTRLLEHEVLQIQARGLRVLTRDLTRERIDRAFEVGALSRQQRDRLHANTVYERNAEKHREGQVCFVLGRTAFSDSSGGCEPLLSMWGGEGIYWALYDDDPPVLGRPAIVVAQVDVHGAPERPYAAPSLAAPLAGALLGVPLYADVHLKSPIEAGGIVDIWQPGHAEYDLHPLLPSDEPESGARRTHRATLEALARSVHIRLDDASESALRVLRSTGLNDSEAVRLALREAANTRRRRSELALEAKRLAEDPDDRAEIAAVRELMDELAPPLE